MKKIRIISIISLAAILLSSVSCKREELIQDTVSPVEPLVFTASIDVTKTTLDTTTGENYGKVYWVTGDEVSINGVIYVASPDASDKTRATLNKKNESDPNPQPDAEGNYLACYPASVCVPDGDFAGEEFNHNGGWHAEFPRVQYYHAVRNVPDISMSPMTANSSTMNLSFTNMGSLVALTLKGSAEDKVQSINLGGYTLYTSKEGVALSGRGIKFYIAIPAENGFDMHIGITLADRRSYSKNAKAPFIVERNKIYTLTLTPKFSPAEDYVQLWENGPYWSTINLGAASPEQAGYHFSWGNITPYSHNGANWVNALTSTVWSNGFCSANYSGTPGAGLSTNIPVNATYDAAYALSGGMDRMPTQQELKDLLNCDNKNYTTLTWIEKGAASGIQITGKGAYSDNKIFIPAGGYGDGDAFSAEGTIGRYWSSNYNSGSGGYANAVRFKHQGKININYNSGEPGYLGLTIRPVKNEGYEPETPNVLQGVFTINNEGKKVKFSKGNLRYTILTKKWSFFDHQYECGPKFYVEGHDKEISLFTFGYNATTSIIPDGTTYDTVDLGGGKGSEETTLPYAKDWGSQIHDGNTWRTLSLGEWQYLVSRTVNFEETGPGESYSVGINYNGMKGVVIYPDNYTGRALTGEVASLPDGVVFLPAAGSREGSVVSGYNDAMTYWTSTDSGKESAHAVGFKDNSLGPLDYNRSDALSVRLVIDVE